MPRHRIDLPSSVACALAALVQLVFPSAARADTASPEQVASLIASLGDDDYHRRESAAAELKALGPTAIDALLAAAETSGDLEVSLRARWLVEAIPFEMPHDPPEVVKLLSRFKRRPFSERVQAMHRLLRVDDDAGIEALARVVRLDPSTVGARVAATLLAREWRADDPAWPAIRSRIVAGLGPAHRPAARFLAALAEFTGGTDAATRAASLAAAESSLADLGLVAADQPPRDAGASSGDEREAMEQTRHILERCYVRMLLAGGNHDAALEVARGIVAEAQASGDERETRLVEALAWAVEVGLPDVFEAVSTATAEGRGLLVELALAHAERSCGRRPEAAARFASALETAEEGSFAERLQAAMLLVKWGCTDWAVQAYDTLLIPADQPTSETALAAVMYSEFLHDFERDEEAARCLERVFAEEPAAGRRNRGPALDALGRDPRSTRSRMHFFKSCVHRRRNELAACRAALEEALATYPKDVDALIGLYQLPDNTPQQRLDSIKRIQAALSQLEDEIQAVPDDATGYNEYAWLVANTEGDLEKATRYSKLSLVKSFDNASYLDTLAHCHAAAGHREAAIRAQRLAQRQEPHNQTIRRSLERFEAAAR